MNDIAVGIGFVMVLLAVIMFIACAGLRGIDVVMCKEFPDEKARFKDSIIVLAITGGILLVVGIAMVCISLAVASN